MVLHFVFWDLFSNFASPVDGEGVGYGVATWKREIN
jgi:hypothetical protein